MTRQNFEFELNRQVVHMLFGLIILAILFVSLLSPQDAIVAAQVFSLSVLICLLFMIDRRTKNLSSPLSDFLLYALERKDSPPAHGAMWYALGSLLALTFLSNIWAIAATIFLLAVADGLSTLIGINHHHPLPHNKKKTIEGTAAFFITGLATYAFIGLLAVPLSFLAALAESLDLGLDDNLTIPLASIVFFKLAGF
ncbi:MAG: hypothetical protein Q7T16_06545 [Candidatus Burarchaeum sp.]|nr:hypothetical protein [Candidatus Burarchaeum sp.]MDO8340288.1 hypothetical protein [Candidatus Burarchaeum sp.]